MGKRLQVALQEDILPLPFVGDVRGRGLFQAVEFVADKYLKTEFLAAEQFSKMVLRAAFDEGLYLHGYGSPSGPHNVQNVLIAPRFNITEEEVDLIVERLRSAILFAGQQLSAAMATP